MVGIRGGASICATCAGPPFQPVSNLVGSRTSLMDGLVISCITFDAYSSQSMNKKVNHKNNCDEDEHKEHGELKPPMSLVLGDVELNEDDAVGDQGDEHQPNHGQAPRLQSG